MTNKELYEQSKYLLRYGEILDDKTVNNTRIRIIELDNAKWIHVMVAGEYITVEKLAK